MFLDAAVWPQFWTQSCCLHTSRARVKLRYRILTLIVAFGIAASPWRVWDCSHFVKLLFFLDRNTPFTSSKLWSVRRWPSDIGGAVGPPWRQLFFSFFAELSASPVNLTAHNFACLYQVILFCSAKETNMFNRRVWNIRSSIWNEGCECRLI